MTAIGSRLAALAGMVLAAAFGLASRTAPLQDWPIVGTYGGDAAWTMAACAGIRLMRPGASIARVALLGYALSVAVECSQLVHIDWLDAIRSHPVGALLLGRGFLWSDLAAYAGGAGVYVLIATAVRTSDGRIDGEVEGRIGFRPSGQKEAESAGRNAPPSG